MGKHREFTYQEKKFNRLGRQGLLDYFKVKIDTSKIRVWALTEHHSRLSPIEAKAIAQKLEEMDWEERKVFIEPMVDGILHLCKMFDLSNLEAFAMWLYVMRGQGELKKKLGREPTEEEIGRIFESSMKDAYELYEKNPNRFLGILKLFT